MRTFERASPPRYGERSLAELAPSLLAAAGVPDFEDVLSLGPLDGFCLLLVDGLGHELLLAHDDLAPVLARAARQAQPLTAAFPSTTAASVATLATGLPPGEHGLVGYTFAVPGFDRPMNALLWELYGVGPPVGLADRIEPEGFQPNATVFERAEAAGVAVARIGPPPHDGTGFTRAVLRGGRFVGAYWLEDVRAAIASAFAPAAGRPTVYAYTPDLDTAGHDRGAGSEAWRGALARVDGFVADVASDLPQGCALVVTGDHGMVNLEGDAKVDVRDRPPLLAGVRMLAGEARARHVYTVPGAEEDVLAAWRETVGHAMWVVRREQAVEEGWFGPVVRDDVVARVGDLVTAAHGDLGVFQREVDPLQANLVGHHGSMTPAEQLVPLAVFRA